MLNRAKVERFILSKAKYLHNLSSTSGSKGVVIRHLDPPPKYFAMPPPQNNFAAPPQKKFTSPPNQFCHPTLKNLFANPLPKSCSAPPPPHCCPPPPQQYVLDLVSTFMMTYLHLNIYACKSAKKTPTK